MLYAKFGLFQRGSLNQSNVYERRRKEQIRKGHLNWPKRRKKDSLENMYSILVGQLKVFSSEHIWWINIHFDCFCSCKIKQTLFYKIYLNIS